MRQFFFALAGVRDGVVEVHGKQEIRSRCNYEVVKSKHCHLGGHISVLDAILGRGGNYYDSSLKEDKAEVELTADPELLQKYMARISIRPQAQHVSSMFSP